MERRSACHAAVVGLCWGDEGKGKIVDMLAPDFAAVVRYNGGANAGHTVKAGSKTFALHQLPAGVLHDGVLAVMGPGVVIDPHALMQEIDELASLGIDIGDRLAISDRAHVVLEYHKTEDRLSEGAATDEARIGTTSRGIGPCYAEKMLRSNAVRMCDLLRMDELIVRLRKIVDFKRKIFHAAYGSDGDLNTDAIIDGLLTCARRLATFIKNTNKSLGDLIAADKPLLFEGANGMLLDVNQGTYPYVTSSSTGSWGIAAGAGVPPQTVSRVIGVTKSYSTRVGAGPLPTELHDATGDKIRVKGHEFGTTTGRPRRCGWLDGVACAHAARLGGVTEIALMHLDTISGFDPIGICNAYRHNDQIYDTLHADPVVLAQSEAVIEMQPGWNNDLTDAESFDALPDAAKKYVRRIESIIGVPVRYIGVGPDRRQTLVREDDGQPAGLCAPAGTR